MDCNRVPYLIKEGWEKIAEQTGNGTLKYSEVLNSLYSQSGGFDVSNEYLLEMALSNYTMRVLAEYIQPTRIIVERIFSGGAGLNYQSYYISADSHYYTGNYSNQGDSSSSTVANGTTFRIYKRKVQ